MALTAGEVAIGMGYLSGTAPLDGETVGEFLQDIDQAVIYAEEQAKYTTQTWNKTDAINGVAAATVLQRFDVDPSTEIYLIKEVATGRVVVFQPFEAGISGMVRLTTGTVATKATEHRNAMAQSLADNRVVSQCMVNMGLVSGTIRIYPQSVTLRPSGITPLQVSTLQTVEAEAVMLAYSPPEAQIHGGGAKTVKLLQARKGTWTVVDPTLSSPVTLQAEAPLLVASGIQATVNAEVVQSLSALSVAPTVPTVTLATPVTVVVSAMDIAATTSAITLATPLRVTVSALAVEASTPAVISP
jgi:hypothetical protein